MFTKHRQLLWFPAPGLVVGEGEQGLRAGPSQSQARCPPMVSTALLSRCMTSRAARNKPNSRRTVVFLFFVCKGGTSRLLIFCCCWFSFFCLFFCNCSGQTYFLGDKMEFITNNTFTATQKNQSNFVHCIQTLNENLAQGLGT